MMVAVLIDVAEALRPLPQLLPERGRRPAPGGGHGQRADRQRAPKSSSDGFQARSRPRLNVSFAFFLANFSQVVAGEEAGGVGHVPAGRAHLATALAPPQSPHSGAVAAGYVVGEVERELPLDREGEGGDHGAFRRQGRLVGRGDLANWLRPAAHGPYERRLHHFLFADVVIVDEGNAGLPVLIPLAVYVGYEVGRSGRRGRHSGVAGHQFVVVVEVVIGRLVIAAVAGGFGRRGRGGAGDGGRGRGAEHGVHGRVHHAFSSLISLTFFSTYFRRSRFRRTPETLDD